MSEGENQQHQQLPPPPQAPEAPPPGPHLAPDRTIHTVLSTRFEVPSYYTDLVPVGYGAYGFVVSALDTRTDKRIAIKKNSRIFRDKADCKRIVREILVLQHLRHENIVHIQDLYLPTEDGPGNFRDVYMVSDLMDTNLYAVIRSPQQAMNESHFKYFIYQLLRGLKFLHSASVMHRDLKPANLLVNVNCDLQICDFGLARQFSDNALTDYVVTRYYRPPEILLMCSHYDYVVDTWSVGCITVELMTRHTLFRGSDYIQQLDLILNHLRPTEEDLSFLETETAMKQVAARVEALRASWGPEPPPIAPSITDPITRDFISKMLVFDPRKRQTPAQLLEHPYLAQLHDPSDEPVASKPFEWVDEAKDLTEDELRDTLIRIEREFAAERGRVVNENETGQ